MNDNRLEKSVFLVFVGKASTLFVVLIQNSLRLNRTDGAVLQQMIINKKRCLSEKLALIPDTKVVIANNLPPMREGNISGETLEVNLSGKGVLTTLLQLLNKRLDTYTGPHFSNAGITKVRLTNSDSLANSLSLQAR